ncbi:hypothetical protein [uncultured Megasphaera sp.]|nr:hypothetical protein [uncultured Megasphaera sp.]
MKSLSYRPLLGKVVFIKNVFIGWTNVLIYKILKVQKNLGISGASPDSRE